MCPAPCEEHCRRDEVDEAIAIRDSHRYAGDQVIKAMLDDGIDPPLPFERQAPSGRRAAVIGSGPAGMSAAYYLLLSGHDVTVFERDPAPGGMLRYGIPQYRLPKVEVLEAEYESVMRLGGKIVCNQELGQGLHARRPPEPGLRRGRRRDRLLRHEQARASRTRTPTSVIDGLEYLRTATLGLPYPGHAGKRVVVVGGGFTSMDCVADLGPPGRGRGHARLPPRHEGHAGRGRGPRGDRGRRHRDLPGRPDARHHRREAGKVTGVEFIRMQLGAPDASGRRRPEPAPGTEFIIPCDRVLLAIGQGPELDLDRARLGGPEATKKRRLKADAVTFETGRPGVFGTGDVRIGAATVVQAIAEGRRAAYAVDAYLKGIDLDGDPDPPDARRAAARVPVDRAVHERDQGAALPAQGDGGRGAQPATTSSTRSRTRREEAVAESTRCLQCTCEAIGFCDLRRLGHRVRDDAQDARAAVPPGRRATARVTENRFTGVNHDYIRDDSHAFILREPSRCIDCGRCANVCAEVVGRRLLRLHADRLRHARHDAARHEPQRHAVRVVRPLRRDVPDRRAHAQAARPPEVRGRREPLHPVRHLRRRLPLRRAPRRRRLRALAHVAVTSR